MLVKQVDVISPLLAPGGQQRMCMLMQQCFVQREGYARSALLAPVLVPQQVLIGNNIAPVVLARVEHRQQYLAEAPDGRQRLKSLRRERGDTEYHHPTWQSCRALIDAQQMIHKARMDARATVTQPLGTYIRQYRTP